MARILSKGHNYNRMTKAVSQADRPCYDILSNQLCSLKKYPDVYGLNHERDLVVLQCCQVTAIINMSTG